MSVELWLGIPKATVVKEEDPKKISKEEIEKERRWLEKKLREAGVLKENEFLDETNEIITPEDMKRSLQDPALKKSFEKSYKFYYKVLKYLYENKDKESFPLEPIKAESMGYKQDMWSLEIGVLWREKYIEGIDISCSPKNLIISNEDNIRITEKGIKHLKTFKGFESFRKRDGLFDEG